MRPGTTRRTLAMVVPVGLLVGSIVGHGYAIVAHEDDPQRSGAFAMFATVDIGATRMVIADAADGTVRLDMPDSLDHRTADLVDHPSEQTARALAAALLDRGWTVEDDEATEGGSTTFDDVRVRVVGLDADGRTLVRQVLVEVSEGTTS
jgi:hypothetical protein